jgi:hypothetical protein
MGKLVRVLLCALLLTLGSAGLAAGAEQARLFPVRSGQRAGFIDVTGVVVIPLKFAAAKEFSEGLAAVQDGLTGQWGYIDRTGFYAIPPQFQGAFPFSEGLAHVRLVDGTEGHIDRSGRLVIKGSSGMLRDGLLIIMEKDKAIFVDRTGKALFEAPRNSWLVGGGLVAFMQNGRMGFMDRRGQVVIPPLYRCDVNWRHRQFEEKIAPVSAPQPDGKEKFGFIDRTGQVVVDFQYDWAQQFFDGLAIVYKAGKYGYVDTAGRVAIPLQYEGADHFSEGLAAVKLNGKWGFIDTQGRMVIPPQYLGRAWGSPMIFREGMAAVRTETGTGAIDRTGRLVIPAIFRSMEDFSGGLILAKGKPGDVYFNKRGEIVWPRQDLQLQP